MTTGGSNCLTRDEKTWCRDIALLDCLLDSPVSATRITNRGKAAVDHPFHEANSTRRHQGQRYIFEVPNVNLAEKDMDMAIYEPWHQSASTTIDYIGQRALDRLISNLANGCSLNQQFITIPDFIETWLKDPEIFKKILTHDWLAPA